MTYFNNLDDNVKKISLLFPHCVVETEEGKHIDFDLLRQELSGSIIDGTKERYRMEWRGKREAILTSNLLPTNTLRSVYNDSLDYDNTENIYIEGDNLEVLKILQKSYSGKVKMIYIDPPYNTGKKFIYNDNFKQSVREYLKTGSGSSDDVDILNESHEIEGRYHSKWLSMMYPRLKLARNLLTDDGVIFISIDDHEVHNLRKLCDEIFGEGNFIGQWNWFKSETPPNLSRKIKKNLEYVLCYEKQKSINKYRGIQKTSNSDDPLTKQQNTIKILTFKPGKLNINLPNQTFPAGIYGTKTYPNKLLNDLVVKDNTNQNEVRFENKFIWLQSKLEEELENGAKVNINAVSLVLSYKKAEYDKEVPPNLIDDSVGVDATENAGSYLQTIMDGNKVFSYPKSVSLIQYLLSFIELENEIILDFFSGSGTTAEAVLKLPKKNKFILVQIPEKLEPSFVSDASEKQIIQNGINLLNLLGKPPLITELGKERIRRAGKKIKEETKAEIDYGFRVYRLDNRDSKEEKTIHDFLIEAALLCELPLDLSIKEDVVMGKSIFKLGGNILYVCFSDDLTEDFLRHILIQNPLNIVFINQKSLDENIKKIMEDQFNDFNSKANIKFI